MKFNKSQALFEEASKCLVGGVNSPVRAFNSVGGNPLFIQSGKGSMIKDVDGNEYIDYVGSYGPLILGHCNPEVVESLKKTIDFGTTFGATTENEIKLANLVQEAFPHMEMVRFVNSGTEAILSALRLVRGITGRKKIIKFSGCYHGHCDALLVQGGSGVMTLGMSGSAGVPESTVENTISIPYNDRESIQKAFEEFGNEIAAVIIEPVAGNMGVIPPEAGFLAFIREITTQHGALFVIDEVMTGFRPGFGGAQHVYDVEPDITCLGKIIGGGLPVGAYGGKRKFMEMIAPLGPVYQAGTLSGNPLAMQAGITTLEKLKQPGAYDALLKKVDRLEEGLNAISKETGRAMQVNRFGSMICVFFSETPIRNYKDAKASDSAFFSKFFWGLLKRGVSLPPSAFEAWFVSMAHTDADIERTLEAVRGELNELGITS